MKMNLAMLNRGINIPNDLKEHSPNKRITNRSYPPLLSQVPLQLRVRSFSSSVDHCCPEKISACAHCNKNKRKINQDCQKKLQFAQNTIDNGISFNFNIDFSLALLPYIKTQRRTFIRFALLADVKRARIVCNCKSIRNLSTVDGIT